MKFVCDRCQTRYSISDEKVRGKVLKIRCKTCSNIIVVREQTGVGQAAAGAAAAAGGSRGPAPRTEVEMNTSAPAGPSGADVEWWVAIKGTQHGPMKMADMEKFFREGRITPRSYCWNEGLSGWSRMRDLPDFAALVKEPQPERRGPPPPPPPADEGGGAGAEVVDLQKARAERDGGAATTGDPFAAAAAASDAAAAPSTPGARPGEATRVFIMNAGLANRKAKHRTYAAIAVVVISVLFVGGWGDWTGRWEIPGLHSALSYAAETTGVEVPKERILASWDDVQPDLEEKCQLNPADPECVKYFNERAAFLRKARAKTRKGKKKAAGGVGDMDLSDAFGTAGPSGGGIDRKTGAATLGDDPFGSDTDRSAEIAAMLSGGKKMAKAPKAKIDAPAVAGGSGLEGEQIAKVVKQNYGSIEACVVEAAKVGNVPGGKQRLILTVQPKGLVSGARFKNGVTNASPVGECIRKRARKWKFPPFAGEAFDIEIPMVLSVGL
jgi:predicted Zn finger-like uncharacterized protein